MLLGLAADVGTLQRLPAVCGGAGSRVRELCLTGEDFGAPEAARLGLVSRVVPGAGPEARGAALALASRLVALSPVAVAGTKVRGVARDEKIADQGACVCVV